MLLRNVLICTILLLLTMPFFHPGLPAQQNDEHPELTQTLDRVDAVSAKFSTFTANFAQKRYLALLKEYESPETGDFYYSIDGNRDVQLRHEIRTPGVRITTIKGDSVVVHQPSIKQAQVYNLGIGNRKNYVEYLATGLGQSSAKLREQFEITYDGAETIGGAPCSVLTLVPKDKSAAASVRSITVWFNNSTGTPMQYKFLEPTRDYMLLTFSQEKLNEKIPTDRFEQKLPKETEIFRLD